MENVCIEFEPLEYNEDSPLAQIKGDMTEWIAINMDSLDGMPGYFNYFCKLAKGYKYRF